MSTNDATQLQSKGLLNLPGSTAESRRTLEDILRRDLDEHHCFYKAPSFHNHLSHQYDFLVVPSSITKSIYISQLARRVRPGRHVVAVQGY